MSERVLKGFYPSWKVASRIAVETGELNEGIRNYGFSFEIPFNQLSRELRMYVFSKYNDGFEGSGYKKADIYINFEDLKDLYPNLRDTVEKDYDFLVQNTPEATIKFIEHHKAVFEEVAKKQKEKPKSTTLIVSYYVSDEFVKNEVERTRTRVGKEHRMSLSMDDIPTDILYVTQKSSKPSFGRDCYEITIESMEVDELLTTVEDIVSLLKRWAEQQTQKPQKNIKEKWILEHGSPHLQRAYKKGYHCQREYASQRSRMEFPDFSLDFEGNKTFQERPFPTEAALDEEDLILNNHPNVEVRIMWDKSEKEEVMVIKNYLSKYTLYKLVKS